ncbi:hypothetical protein ALP39_04901 [Pseudomonas marginalis pv. marginalis]|nr:hypothetical protein ALP39_04901 [Pseudomonas marginalis pv. marginalis]
MVSERQFAAKGTHQGLTDRQAQPQALGAGLGGVKRLAGAAQRFHAKPWAIVADVQVDAQRGGFGTQPEFARWAFFGEGVEGVGQQVAQHLAQTGFAGLHPQRCLRQITDQLHFHRPPPLGQQRECVVQRRLQGHALRRMSVASGEGAQVGDDRGHTPGQFADQLEVAPRIGGAFMVQQDLGVFRIAANRGQGLIEFVADTRRHGAQRRQLARLHQIILGAHQFLLGVFALQHFLFEPPVQAFQIAGPFDHSGFQLATCLGFKRNAIQVMATSLHHQTEQQHQHQQRGTTHRDHRAHRAADQGLRREDFHVPAGLGDGRGLAQPRGAAQAQRLWVAGRVGLDRNDRLALFGGQWPSGAEPPLRARGEDHHAVVVGDQQLFRRVAPQAFGVVQVDLDHQHADDLVTLAHGSGEEVTAFGRRCTQAEKPPQAPGHGFAEVGAEREVAPDKTVLFVPVRGGEGLAGGVHQVHHFHAGLGGDVLEQQVGVDLVGADVRRVQHGAQGGQVAEDLWQHFIAVQGAQQVGDVQVEGLAVLPGQFAAVIALGQVLQWPQQRCQAQRQQGEAAPAGSSRKGWSHGSRAPVGTGALCLVLLCKTLAQCVLPVWLADVPLLLQAAAIEARVQWALGGRRVGAGRDRLKFSTVFPFGAQVLANRLGEAEPRRLTLGRQVIDAPFPGLAGLPTLDQCAGAAGNGAGPCWRANLVGHDAHLRFLLQQTLHGQQEILARVGVDPTGAQNQVFAAHRCNRLLARQLALAVDTQRVRRVDLGVGRRLAAVENVVGGVVNQRNAQGLGFLREDAGGDGVDGEGGVRFAFGLIDCRVGGGVDDQVGAMGAGLLADLLRFGQVELVAAEHNQLAQPLKVLLQCLGDLAMLAGNQNLHGNRSASISSLPAWSLADSCGGSVSSQSMASVGSFHRMLRSALGW